MLAKNDEWVRSIYKYVTKLHKRLTSPRMPLMNHPETFINGGQSPASTIQWLVNANQGVVKATQLLS